MAQISWTDVYAENGSIRLHGRQSDSTHEYRRFLQGRLRERLRRASTRTQLREYIEELNSTGFAVGELATIAETDLALRPWEVGEVLAELLLEDLEGATFPWPPSWDKRIVTASLPGPDLIGFVGASGDETFLFGEAKTSDAKNVVSSVVYGDDGLRAQIERLIVSGERRELLIGWLLVRSEGSPWRPTFERALASYCARPSRAAVVGVLLCGKEPDIAHLAAVKSRCHELAPVLIVSLLAFYVPIPPDEWAQALEGTENQP